MPFHGMFRSWKGPRRSPSPTPCQCRNPVPHYLCIVIQPLFKQWRRMCLFLRQTVPILNSLTIRKFWCSAKIYFIMITSCSVSWNNSEQFCLSLHDGPSDTWRWPSCLPAALSSPYYTFPIPLSRFLIIFLPDSLRDYSQNSHGYSLLDMGQFLNVLLKIHTQNWEQYSWCSPTTAGERGIIISLIFTLCFCWCSLGMPLLSLSLCNIVGSGWACDSNPFIAVQYSPAILSWYLWFVLS